MRTDQFFICVAPLVHHLCRVSPLVSTVCSHEDVAQEALLAVWRALPAHRPEVSSVATYASVITRRKLIDAYRAACRDRSIATGEIPEYADAVPGPEELALLAERRRRLAALVAQLPPAQQRLLELRFDEDATMERAAEVLDVPVSTAKSAQHRALARLRRLASCTAGLTQP